MQALDRLVDPPSVLLALGATAAAYVLQLPHLEVATVPIAVLAVRALAGLLMDPRAVAPEVGTGGPRAPLPRSLLSRRELQVALLVGEGLTNKEIGDRLFIEESTVDTHVDHIKNKLVFDHKTQIAAWWAITGGDDSKSPPKSPLA